MQPTLCSRCKKNVAVVFISKLDGEKTINEGLCLKCAKELGLPQVDDMMKRMGISDEDLETLNSEMMQAMNGVETIEDLPGGDEGELMRSLKRLWELEGDYQVLPGHEGQSTLERERSGNYCLRAAMGR